MRQERRAGDVGPFDVLVLGSGVAGLSVAVRLCRASPRLREDFPGTVEEWRRRQVLVDGRARTDGPGTAGVPRVRGEG